MRTITLSCIVGAIICTIYDLGVKHVPLTSWRLDPATIIGFILVIVALFTGSKIKPKGS